jgi:hypothetical protein
MFKWPLTKSSHGQPSGNTFKTKEALVESLHQEVRSAAPGARLSGVIRTNLERLEKPDRRDVVSMTPRPDGCAPLFIGNKIIQKESITNPLLKATFYEVITRNVIIYNLWPIHPIVNCNLC